MYVSFERWVIVSEHAGLRGGNRKTTYDLKLNNRWRLMYSSTRSSRRYLTDWPRPKSRRINVELTSLGTQLVISVMLL